MMHSQKLSIMSLNFIKNKIKYTNSLCRTLLWIFFYIFVEGCDPCLLTSFSVLYTTSCEMIKLCYIGNKVEIKKTMLK